MLRHPLLVPAIRLDGDDGEAEVSLALQRAQAPWCAGFILFGGEADQVARLTARLREAAGRALFVASDMERGAGQQIQGLRTLPEAGVFGAAATPFEVEQCGRITAEDALSVGVDVVFAPVLDVSSEPRNPIVGHRAYGWDPARVAALGAAFARGVRAAGALPVGKHYPGHGATQLDSHVAKPVVEAPRALLEVRDLLPFDVALRTGALDAVMTAHVAYPSLDPLGRIATLSPPILERLRVSAAPRDVIAFTDALRMEGAHFARGVADAARAALVAGCDLLLYADREEALATSLEDVDDELARRVTARIDTWLAGRGAEVAPRVPDDPIHRVTARAVALAWPGGTWGQRILLLDDDGVRGRGDFLGEAAAHAGAVCILRRLSEEGPPSPADLQGVDLVVLMASIHMAKGPGGLGAAAQETLGRWRALPERRPRLVALGAWVGDADLHIPGTHPALEAALAHRLFEASP